MESVTSSQTVSIPGFSSEQITGLVSIFSEVLRTELDRHEARLQSVFSRMLKAQFDRHQPSTQSVTQPVTQSVTQSQQKKKRNEKTRQQYKRREKSTEKEGYRSSYSQASSTRIKASLSAFTRLSAAPHQYERRDSHHPEVSTVIWAIISTCAIVSSSVKLSKQEKDLLERSQPVGPNENEQVHGPNSMRIDADVSGFSRICRCSNESD